ncbi:MAG: choice-of-anchor T family protein [Thermoplasmatota archaeon]
MRREILMSYRLSLVALATICILLSFAEVSGSGIDGGLGPLYAEPEIDIEITPGKYDARVGPNDEGIVTIIGTVTCQMPSFMPPNVYCVVSLSANTAGWESSDPADLAFSAATTIRTFSMQIQVPLLTPPEESRDIQISGTWTYSPGTQSGSTESETVFITVLPYVHIIITADGSNTTIEIGERSTFTIELENRGTGTASVAMAAAADDERMTVELDKRFVEIPPHRKVQVLLTVQQTSGSQGHFYIKFSAEETNQGTQGPLSMTFQVFSKDKSFSISSIPYLTPIIIVVVFALVITGSLILFLKLRSRRKGRSTNIIASEVP